MKKMFSEYVYYVSEMIHEAEPEATLYMMENGIFLNKLLAARTTYPTHLDISPFKLAREKQMKLKVFTWETGWETRKDLRTIVQELFIPEKIKKDNERDFNTMVRELQAEGCQIFLLPEYNNSHLTILDRPERLWFEGYHPKRSKYAYNCTYTDKPI